MTPNILVLNCGSSSVKFEVITENEWQRVVYGAVERIGGDATVTVHRDGDKRQSSAPIHDAKEANAYVLKEVIGEAHIRAAGHRVVHGGERFPESALVTDDVIAGIQECAEIAPLHNPANLAGIAAVKAIFGEQLPQVAGFDTSFHHGLPERAYLYAIPYRFYEQYKVRRYGFHGTSYRYLSERYRELTGKSEEETNIIALHLGNGCSICAIRAGKPVDTSMGFTPLEGLAMGTRSGDLDASIVDFLMRKEKQTGQELESMLNLKSGLLGLSGLTNDMRDLMKQAGSNPRANVAVELFCYRARKYVGAYLAAMGGADAIVFSAGIGENNAEIRQRICDGMQWFGIEVDHERNKAMVGKEDLISSDGSRVAVYVIPTNEELMIARDTSRLAPAS